MDARLWWPHAQSLGLRGLVASPPTGGRKTFGDWPHSPRARDERRLRWSSLSHRRGAIPILRWALRTSFGDWPGRRQDSSSAALILGCAVAQACSVFSAKLVSQE